VLLFVWPALWIVPTYFTHRADVLSRTHPMLYELDSSTSSRFGELCASLDQLASCAARWRVGALADNHDLKRNAGAGTFVDRRPFRVLRGSPPFIASNVEARGLELGDQQLWFMPDRLYVYQAGRYGVVEYSDLKVVRSDERFIEDGPVPSDAAVVGHTWLKVNKDGSPDRRFAHNRQIPVALYERAELRSSGGLNIYLQLSRRGSSQLLLEWCRRAASAGRPTNPMKQSGPASSSSPVGDCFATLGVPRSATRAEAESAYRQLIANYQTARISHLPEFVREMAQERLDGLNRAFAELRALKGW